MSHRLRMILLILVAVSAAAISVLSAPPVGAATFTVNSTGDEPDADLRDRICLTASGTCTLRAAIQQANATGSPDTITLPAGVYVLTVAGRNEDAAATGDLDIKRKVTIIGAAVEATIIDGNLIDRVFDVQRQATLNISRVTIRNGLAISEGTTNPQSGGGIRIQRGATLNVTDAVVTNNTATIDISHCTCGNRGGAIYADAKSRLQLTNVVVSNNLATDPGGQDGLGGGIQLDSPNKAVLTDVSVIGNTSAGAGGGIVLQGRGSSTVTLTDVTIDNNAAMGGVGAGMAATGRSRDRLMLTNVTISDNQHDQNAGIYSEGITAVLTNVTISGNYRGVAIGGGTATLTNVTVANNLAGISGGPMTLKNTILANSTTGINCEGSGPITSAGNNLDSGNTCGFSGPGDLNNTDPILGPLANNGGPTKTHALPVGSPAIDAGTNTGCPSTDQRGLPRPRDGDGNGSSICDMGAFEAQ